MTRVTVWGVTGSLDTDTDTARSLAEILHLGGFTVSLDGVTQAFDYALDTVVPRDPQPQTA